VGKKRKPQSWVEGNLVAREGNWSIGEKQTSSARELRADRGRMRHRGSFSGRKRCKGSLREDKLPCLMRGNAVIAA